MVSVSQTSLGRLIFRYIRIWMLIHHFKMEAPARGIRGSKQPGPWCLKSCFPISTTQAPCPVPRDKALASVRVASVQVKHGDPNQQRGYGAVPFCYRPAFHPPVPLLRWRWSRTMQRPFRRLRRVGTLHPWHSNIFISVARDKQTNCSDDATTDHGGSNRAPSVPGTQAIWKLLCVSILLPVCFNVIVACVATVQIRRCHPNQQCGHGAVFCCAVVRRPPFHSAQVSIELMWFPVKPKDFVKSEEPGSLQREPREEATKGRLKEGTPWSQRAPWSQGTPEKNKHI